MVNLFEILQNAQGGQAMENLARQFNLTQQQTQDAVEALLPAFSMGLKRQASEPAAAPNLFAMMSGPFAQSFENPFAAFTPQATNQGNDALGALFGSKEVSRAVADQAAALSGIGPQVLKAMLPVLASILMGGLAKSASAQPQLQDIFGQMIGGMMGGGTAGVPGGSLGGGAANPQVQPNPNGGGLLGAILGSLLQQGAQQSGQAAPAPPPRQAEPVVAPGADIFGQMFETGRQIQQTHLDTLQSIFDAYNKKG